MRVGRVPMMVGAYGLAPEPLNLHGAITL